MKFESRYTLFIKENELEHEILKMVAILSQSRCEITWYCIELINYNGRAGICRIGQWCHKCAQGSFLPMASERQRYIVTLSLIGWAHTQNDPCMPMAWCHHSSSVMCRVHIQVKFDPISGKFHKQLLVWAKLIIPYELLNRLVFQTSGQMM